MEMERGHCKRRKRNKSNHTAMCSMHNVLYRQLYRVKKQENIKTRKH